MQPTSDAKGDHPELGTGKRADPLLSLHLETAEAGGDSRAAEGWAGGRHICPLTAEGSSKVDGALPFTGITRKVTAP